VENVTHKFPIEPLDKAFGSPAFGGVESTDSPPLKWGISAQIYGQKEISDKPTNQTIGSDSEAFGSVASGEG
jgi:hypothetical protein